MDTHIPKMMDNLRWRRIVHFVAFVDFICSMLMTILVVSFGLALYEEYNQHKKKIEQLGNQAQLSEISDEDWSCVPIFFVALAFACLFLLCDSIVLSVATEKSVELKSAVKGALAWRNDMCQFLAIISLLFCCIVWKFNVNCYVLEAMIVFIFERVLFIFIVNRFVKECRQRMAAWGPHQPNALNV